MNIRSLAVVIVCSLVFSAARAEDSSAPGALRQLLADEWAARMRDDPLAATQSAVRDYDDRLPAVAPADFTRRANQDREFQKRLAAIDRASLGEQDRVNYDLFEFVLRHRVALAPYRAWRIPLTSDEGFHIEAMRMGIGVDMRSVKDYENYIARLHALPASFA